MDLEQRRSPDRPFGIEVLRACAASALGDIPGYRHHLENILATAWKSVDYFTFNGVVSLAARLWKASSCLPDDDGQKANLAKRLLHTGVAPDEVFEVERLAQDLAMPVNYYRCTTLQPLKPDWAESNYCLSGQSGWKTYRCFWGVLARDEEEAGQLAYAQQVKCYELDPTVEKVEDLDQKYTDKPGVLWQGVRWSDDVAMAPA